jgi:SAM-dependent methyltransferase
LSKEAEQAYLGLLGDAGRMHSLLKPFSDPYCGINLASIGSLISLMPAPPGRILDLGCGGGWTSVFYARYGFEVVGQDIAQDMIDLSEENKRIHNIGDNLSFLCADYEDLTFDSTFDCAVFFDCLHHADDELAAIRSAYQALKPGGLLLTHEPGEGHSIAPGSIEAMRLYGVNERDMPPSLIIRRGREVGFRIARVYPMQHELQTVFYGDPPPKLLSKAGWNRAKRVLRLAFNPSHRQSSIVAMVK